MELFKVLNEFKETAKVCVTAIKEGYNAARSEGNADNTESGENVFLCIVSAGENKEAVVQLLCEVIGWEFDEVEEMIEDLPAIINTGIEVLSYVEQELHKLGADAYLVEEDELVYLKISSLGRDEELVTSIVSKVMDTDLEQARISLSDLPLYLCGPIEYAEKYYKRLSDSGAEATIMGKADWEAEMGIGDEDDGTQYVLQIVSAGANKVSVTKLIRECTGMGLVEATDFVRNLPQNINGSLVDLQAFQEELSKLGAESSIIPIGGKMKKYVCDDCGWVYDEATGIRFENLPNAFNCPVCHADKASFSEITNSSPAQPTEGNATGTQKCRNCGADIMENAKFCSSCGAAL